jgi:hypothetical protein
MAVRPNFDRVELKGSELIVSGQSDDHPLPADIRVFVEQDGRVAQGAGDGGVEKLTTAWTATLDAEGFHTGTALGFGVEIRTLPFESSSWSQIVTIE